MSKYYNYSYYGIPGGYDRFWDGCAYCTANNIWSSDNAYTSIYTLNGSARAETWGKPLDNTIALWKIRNDMCYSTNAAICIDIGNNNGDKFRYDLSFNQQPSAVPLAGCALQNSSTAINAKDYNRQPHRRLSDETTYEMGFWASPLLYDIDYSAFCVLPNIIVWDDTTDTVYDKTLAECATFIDESPSHRYIVGFDLTVFRGSSTSRSEDHTFIPPEVSGGTAIQGVPVFDILTNRPIPPNASAVKNRIEEVAPFSPTPYPTEFNTESVFSPFCTVPTVAWYTTENMSTSLLHSVGLFFPRSISEIQAGYRYVDSDDHSKGKVTGEFTRLNLSRKSFEDVTYHFDIAHFLRAAPTMVYIEQGFSLSAAPSTGRIRTVSRLIVDSANSELSYGEAATAAIKHEIAALGLYFVETRALATSGVLGSASDGEGIYLPVFDGDVTTGRYVTGSAIHNATNADYHSVENYRPSGEDTINDKTQLPAGTIGLSLFTSAHICSYIEVFNIYANLKTMDWSIANREALFFGQNPYDFIVSITGYPLVVYPPSMSNYKSDIELGKVNLNDLPDMMGPAEGYSFNGGVEIYKNPFGSMNVDTKYSKAPYNMPFLDYEPFTVIQLYLPYAGMVSIPPSVFMGNRIDIDMAVDFMSGDVVYFIYANGLEYTTANGNMASEVPVSGLDYTSYKENQLALQRNIINSSINYTNSTLGHLAGASVSASFHNDTGATAQTITAGLTAMQGFINVNFDNYTRTHLAPEPVAISNGSASLGSGNEQDARLFILRPVISEDITSEENIIKNFTKTRGKATNVSGKLSLSSGFTIMLNPILDGIDCTAEEKQMIIDCLKNGVIL